MTQKELELLLESVLEIGRRMIQSGAEIKRVEDTIKRICTAYKISKIEVYALNRLIIATIKTNEGLSATQSVAIVNMSNNLGALEGLNELSRKICKNPPPIAQIEELAQQAVAETANKGYIWIGYLLAAFSFAIFFGGNLLDGIASGLIGIAIYGLDKLFNVHDSNKLIYTMINCFISGSLAIVLVKIGLGNNMDKVMIGNVMLFIPTLALVNGVRDLFYRDIITGIYRIIEALLIGAVVALGFGLSIILLGGVL